MRFSPTHSSVYADWCFARLPTILAVPAVFYVNKAESGPMDTAVVWGSSHHGPTLSNGAKSSRNFACTVVRLQIITPNYGETHLILLRISPFQKT